MNVINDLGEKMNAWVFYLLSLLLVLISRISLDYTSALGAFISLVGLFMLMAILDKVKITRAKYFNLPIYYLIIIGISVLGIFLVDTSYLRGFLSFLIHCCVSFLLCMLVYDCYKKENSLN